MSEVLQSTVTKLSTSSICVADIKFEGRDTESYVVTSLDDFKMCKDNSTVRIIYKIVPLSAIAGLEAENQYISRVNLFERFNADGTDNLRGSILYEGTVFSFEIEKIYSVEKHVETVTTVSFSQYKEILK